MFNALKNVCAIVTIFWMDLYIEFSMHAQGKSSKKRINKTKQNYQQKQPQRQNKTNTSIEVGQRTYKTETEKNTHTIYVCIVFWKTEEAR